MDLYIHFPIRLHGVVLNELSTRATLSFTLFLTSRQMLDCYRCLKQATTASLLILCNFQFTTALLFDAMSSSRCILVVTILKVLGNIQGRNCGGILR
jgi:hypothetical protein